MNNTLYHGGPILTMTQPATAHALLVRKGRIVYCGELEEAAALADEQTQWHNLNGATLMPAFIDAHSHLTQVGDAMAHGDLSACLTAKEICDTLAQWAEEQQVAPGKWVIGIGYDNSQMQGPPPTAQELEQALPQHPALIMHISGHMGVANYRGLRELAICNDTADPPGGHIGRDADGGLNGYLEENALISRTRQIPKPTEQQRMEHLEKAQQLFLSHGIATCQEGRVTAGDFEFLTTAAKAGALQLDTVAYVDMKSSEDLLGQPGLYRNYQRNLRLGGYKIFLDGSPQARTAWMSAPYLNGREGYKGYPIYTDDAVRDFCAIALEQNVQLLAHCNGDAAAQQFIDAYEKALGSCRSKESIRPVMIHAQTLRHDQLERMAKLGMLVSFFTAHTYYWGDVHLHNLGPERALAISPAQWAQELGVSYTFHQDAPVTPPDMWRTVWCAVNRISKQGTPMGDQQRVSVQQALEAVTLRAAFQYFEEDEKGSLERGKLADLMIIDQNPLEIDPMALCDIKVLQTIKEGFPLWQRP